MGPCESQGEPLRVIFREGRWPWVGRRRAGSEQLWGWPCSLRAPRPGRAQAGAGPSPGCSVNARLLRTQELCFNTSSKDFGKEFAKSTFPK